jgi:hypothetical protein
MKTEKRKAKVGERILITNKYLGEDRYENGDVLTVLGLEGSSGDVYVFSKDSGLVSYYEYEVVVDEKETEADNVGIIEKMQAEIEELKKRVAALEAHPRTNMPEEVREDLKRRFRDKQQKRRDEIIEKAKRDVAYIPSQYGFNGYNFEFIVNKEKRTVVVLRRYRDGHVLSHGIAKCAPDDCFNVHIGKAIALRRALGLEVPDEYLNAPQPTEVRVGDVIYVPYLPFSSIRRVTDNPFLSIIDEIGVFTAIRYLSSYSEVRIIDDSREKE